MRISSINPIGWAHAELQGGLRRSALIGVGYLVVALIVIGMAYRTAMAETVPVGSFATVVLSVLMALEAMLLLMFVSSNVRKAVQKDFTSGMMESHRLCPVSGWTAVLGYLTGPAVHVAGLTAANLMMVLLLALATDLGVSAFLAWCFGLFLAMVAAGMLGVLSLLLAMYTRASMGAVGLLTFLLIFGGAQLVLIVPGLGVMTGFLPIAATIRTAGAGGLRIDMNVIYAASWQFALSIILASAAARRFPRDDQQAFSWRLGLIGVVLAAQAGCIGLALWLDHYRMRWRMWMSDDFGWYWIPTFGMMLPVCILPIASAAKSRVRWLQQRSIDSIGAGRSALPVLPVSLLCALIVGSVAGLVLGPAVRMETAWQSLIGGVHPHALARHCLLLGIINAGLVLLALLPLGGVLQALYGYREKIVWLGLIWLVVTWAGPPFADMVRYAFSDERNAPDMTWLMACSPIGAWAFLWYGPSGSWRTTGMWNALGVQIALAVVFGVALPKLLGRRQLAAYRRRIEQADAAPAVVTSPAAPSAAALRR